MFQDIELYDPEKAAAAAMKTKEFQSESLRLAEHNIARLSRFQDKTSEAALAPRPARMTKKAPTAATTYMRCMQKAAFWKATFISL